ncbi:hypothetical protein BSPWISOXPB_5656 [uncultured Gammaproteobacteria bacterium]|nr:hypothetical protein BSPWISOXPB_5656 [uncultured Gammaproteobacteria bacterium]
MLNKIIDGALHNRLMIVLMLLAIVVGAFIMLPKLNLDAFLMLLIYKLQSIQRQKVWHQRK